MPPSDAKSPSWADIARGRPGLALATVEPLLTHTHWWTAQAMGYEGLWVKRGMAKNGLQIRKNRKK